MADDPVVYLRARHARAEQLARACPPGQSLLSEPADVLARVYAERAVLAEHTPEWGHCSVCAEENYDGAERMIRQPVYWPCLTVRLLATGWGWTEEQHG